jgi:hypothetical protein
MTMDASRISTSMDFSSALVADALLTSMRNAERVHPLMDGFDSRAPAAAVLLLPVTASASASFYPRCHCMSHRK